MHYYTFLYNSYKEPHVHLKPITSLLHTFLIYRYTYDTCVFFSFCICPYNCLAFYQLIFILVWVISRWPCICYDMAKKPILIWFRRAWDRSMLGTVVVWRRSQDGDVLLRWFLTGQNVQDDDSTILQKVQV